MTSDTIKSPRTPAPLSGIRSFNFFLLRRLLHLWIRPRIINASADKLGLDESLPVCYVLPRRSLADLLVVDHACEEGGIHLPHAPLAPPVAGEERSFFFLAHAEGRYFKRRSYRVHSARMLRLLAALRAQRDLDVQLVPVSLFWGHAPEREKSIFKLMLSDTWTATNRLKKFFALLFQPRHIVVQFSAPIRLRELVDGEPDERRQARKLARILRVHFRLRKQAIIGPDLSHRRTMVGAIVSSRAVQDAINETSGDDRKLRQQAEVRARKYANEIAADQSYRVIHFLYRLLTWFWSRIYRGFLINRIEVVQELAQSHEVVYIPCHRSHIDYLILSYLLYLNGLSLPHIAAGRNMNIPLVGPLLRRGGAFFMRRSFQDDELYKAVFDEYLYMTFSKGFPVEYFVEGGRSRTGRTLDPRMGLLGMTVRSFLRKPSPPVVFVPVYFGYEKVLEAATYIGELRGQEKRDESILDIIRALKLVNLEFGKVHVNFGAPLFLAEFLDEHLPGWRGAEVIERERLYPACAALGHHLAVHINRATAVTPINLLAVILLATSHQRISETALHTQIELFRRVLHLTRYSDEVTITDLPAAEVVGHGERLSIISRMEAPYSGVVAAEGDLAVLLTYYRNNVAHLLALPALIARLVTSHRTIARDDLLANCRALYPYLAAEYFLRWEPDEVAGVLTEYVDDLAQLALLRADREVIEPAPLGSSEYTCLLLLGEVIEPTLQRFFIAGSLVTTARERPPTQAELEASCRHVAEEIAAIYRFNAPEFFQPSLFTTFLTGLLASGTIAGDAEALSASESLRQLVDRIAPLLDHDVRQGVHESVNALQARARAPDTHRIDSTFPSG